MKKVASGLVFTLFTIIAFTDINAQTKNDKPSDFMRNNINGYLGFVELNINYERNILNLRKSFSNLRMGIGYGAFATAGEGLYLNPSLVHLIGRKNSFLELDLGFKYIIAYTGLNPDYSQFFLPDFFAGYRYERPGSKRIFRIGINWPTLLNAGMGFKF